LIATPPSVGANGGSDRNLLSALRVLFPEPLLAFGSPEMTVSRSRWSLTGAFWAALILAPALCSAQTLGETGPNGGSNLTRETQNEIDIALPSLAPLVERLMPAVVNISVEL
jgi:S1-C subfamily serine protease